MPGNAVTLDQRHEVDLGVAAQCRMAEARIVRQKVCGARVQIGKIAAPAAGYANLLARMARLLQHQHRASAPSCDGSTHQAGGARAEDDDVMVVRLRVTALRHSTSSTSTATPSFCLRDPTMMPSTGETSEKSRPTASMM